MLSRVLLSCLLLAALLAAPLTLADDESAVDASPERIRKLLSEMNAGILRQEYKCWFPAFTEMQAIGTPVIPYIEAAFDDAGWNTQIYLVELAWAVDKTAAYPMARRAAASDVWNLQTAVFDLVSREKNKDSMDVLIAMTTHTRPGRLRHRLLDCLYAWTGESFGEDMEYWPTWWEKQRETFTFPETGGGVQGESPNEVIYNDLKVVSKSVLFVIDMSASMQWGDRKDLAKKELRRVIESFSEDVSFNIIFFAKDVDQWRDDLVPATKKNKEAAKLFIFRRGLDEGTNTYGALSAALNSTSADTIYFLSDGDPTVGEITSMEVIEEVITQRNLLKRIAIHCIGFFIGEPPAAYRDKTAPKEETLEFMKTLAAHNWGEFIDAGEPRKDDPKKKK